MRDQATTTEREEPQFLPAKTWSLNCPADDCGRWIYGDTPSEVNRLMREHREADHGHCDRCGYECRGEEECHG